MGVPIVLGGKRLSEDVAEGLWEELDAAANTLNADAAKVPDAFEPGRTPNAQALDRRPARGGAVQPDHAPVTHGPKARRR